MNKKFGQHLRQLRKKKDFSQRDLAEQLKVNWTYISKLETGALEPPSDALIHQIAMALEADEDTLLNLAGKIPRGLKEAMKDNPLLVELAFILSRQQLSDETYSKLLKIAKGAL